MKKRMVCVVLVLLLCLSVCLTSFAEEMRQASGSCSMSMSGRDVSFSGYSTSAQTEDVISIRVTLWEKRGSKWYSIDSSYNSAENKSFVSTSGSTTVSGGHYYKVTGVHYSMKNGVSYSVTSETVEKWIG